MDYENTIYLITLNQNFHPWGLLRNKHSKELYFLTLFYGHSWQFYEILLY